MNHLFKCCIGRPAAPPSHRSLHEEAHDGLRKVCRNRRHTVGKTHNLPRQNLTNRMKNLSLSPPPLPQYSPPEPLSDFHATNTTTREKKLLLMTAACTQPSLHVAYTEPTRFQFSGPGLHTWDASTDTWRPRSDPPLCCRQILVDDLSPLHSTSQLHPGAHCLNHTKRPCQTKHKRPCAPPMLRTT